jgi:hypothetical protein
MCNFPVGEKQFTLTNTHFLVFLNQNFFLIASAPAVCFNFIRTIFYKKYFFRRPIMSSSWTKNEKKIQSRSILIEHIFKSNYLSPSTRFWNQMMTQSDANIKEHSCACLAHGSVHGMRAGCNF